ncbi:hypothetical protein ACYCFC_06840 [Stutzerimonas sp. NM35]|uniref:hypothetical protein n=1 Tax=Stutzerimonas kunmingensis TaxID=1211807 RepID=UPI00289E1C1A|nr:hypothetical protein [Stutzerimonas kunmingensis]
MHNNRKKWASLFVLYMVIAAPAYAEQAQAKLQAIQEMRSLAFLTCANVLVYFNQNGSPYEVRNKQGYQQQMVRLRSLATSTEVPDVVAELERLQTRLDDTDKLPQESSVLRATEPSYSRVLLPVIESHAHLQVLLDKHYAQAQSGEPLREQGELHALSRAIGQLMVGYQIASFSRLGAETWVMRDEQIRERDQQVTEAFERLSAEHPEHAEALKRSARQYVFVRGVVLQQDGNWSPNGVERYMQLTITEVDQIARGLLK